jgi:hypothetical protein
MARFTQRQAAIVNCGDDVHVSILAALDVLLFLYLSQGLDLVSIDCRLFKGEFRCRLIHCRRETADHVLLATLQEQRRHLQVLGITHRVDQTDAGCRAAFDLVEQTRPRAVVEHRILASAQTKHLLQQMDARAHRR